MSSKAVLFLELSTAISCKDEEKKALLINQSTKEAIFGLKTPKTDTVRVGIIGAGNRGQTLIQMFDWLIKNNKAEIVAISDLKKEKTDLLINILKSPMEKLQKHIIGILMNGKSCRQK